MNFNQKETTSSRSNYNDKNLNFKWTPVSLKYDFQKIEGKKLKQQIHPFRQTALDPNESPNKKKATYNLEKAMP